MYGPILLMLILKLHIPIYISFISWIWYDSTQN